MKYLLIVLMLSPVVIIAQQNNVFTLSTTAAKTTKFASGWIALDSGWKFKAGDNPDWAKPGFDDSSWHSINIFKALDDVPGIFSKNNIVWFRMRLITDSTLLNKQLVMRIYQIGASEIYLDGKLTHRLGIVSANSDSARYYSPNTILLSFPIKYNTEQTLAIRFANLPARYRIYSGSSNLQLEPWISTIDNAADDYFVRFYRIYNSRINIGIGAGAVLCFLYLSFFIFLPARKINLYFSLCNFFFVLSLLFYSVSLNNHKPNFGFNIAKDACLVFYLFSLLYCIYKIFDKKPGWIYWSLLVTGIISFLSGFFVMNHLNDYVSILVLADILRISIRSLRMNKSGAGIILGFSAIDLVYFTLSLLSDLDVTTIPDINSYLPFALLIAPSGLAIDLGIAFGKTSQSLRQKLTEVERLSQEKQQILSSQNETLEKQVKERTSALNQSLENLKSTQDQLIQSEKMASLGELTAGIAHEIQNPLNFVNNFSEVNKELLEELKSQTSKLKNEEVDELLDDIAANEEKINHHGKRADAIVKGMMQHSQLSTGQKESTDINALADEYLRLSFHGIRAKDKSFNATIKSDFDNSIAKVNVIPQDIGRVLLNLYNNAFYAVNEKVKTDDEDYQPTVSVGTKKVNDKIEIRVSDNGNGIPQKIVDKIFQPFFTTKPTGQGTGLGLSLSYDIIKAHGGEIKVEAREGEGTTFIIKLPVT